MIFIDEKKFKFEIRYILIDLNYIFPMELSDFKTYLSVTSDDEKYAENYRYCYVAEKHIVFKLSKISISNF